MMANNDIILSIVLPSYQEEENLRNLLPRLIEVLELMEIKSEILIVDTLEPLDHTKTVCEQYGARYITRRGGNNFGDAVRTGISEANGYFVLLMDADGSHTPEFIPELFCFADQFDVVIASRYIAKGHTENSLLLILMSRLLNLTFSLILNLPCKDVSNSFKIYRGDQLKSLKLTCNNFDIVEEILFKLSRNKPGFKIKEVPFTFKKRMFGQTKRNLFLFILTYLITILKLRFGK